MFELILVVVIIFIALMTLLQVEGGVNYIAQSRIANNLISNHINRTCSNLFFYRKNDPFWQEAVKIEIIYLSLISFLYVLFFDGTNKKKEMLSNRIIDSWVNSLCDIYGIDKNQQNFLMIKNILRQKECKYKYIFGDAIQTAIKRSELYRGSTYGKVLFSKPYLSMSSEMFKPGLYTVFLKEIKSYLEGKISRTQPVGDNLPDSIYFIANYDGILDTVSWINKEMIEENMREFNTEKPVKSIIETIHGRNHLALSTATIIMNDCYRFCKEYEY